MTDGPALSRQERRAFRRDIAPAIRAALAESLAAEDPWELESLAIGLAGPEALGSLEDAYALEAVAMAAETPGARTLLAALAAVAFPPIHGAAARAESRLAGQDAHITAAGLRVGTLQPYRSWALGPESSPRLVHLALRRPGVEAVQLVSFDLDHEEGGSLADGIASAPLPEAELGEVLEAVVPEAPEPRPLAIDAARRVLLDALRACVETDRGPTVDAREALPLAVRALAPGEEGEGLLSAIVDLPVLVLLDEDDEGEEPDRPEAVAEALVEGFAQACAAEGMDEEAVELGTRVAREMMRSRADEDAGPLDWDAAAVRSFLLGRVAHLEMAPGDEDAVVEATASMLVFLGLVGLIEKRAAGALAQEALSLREDVRIAAGR